MRKSRTEPTTTKNLEEKFDRGEDVLDYFDVRKARVIAPRSASSGAKAKFAHPVKRNAGNVVVREKSATYRKHKKATRS